ncbi:MAG: hypothetical protein E7012_04405 [Alphaproteobacteria bacterium]|nr:hypothetical protein [Alphaproteobacteria bacterium]
MRKFSLLYLLLAIPYNVFAQDANNELISVYSTVCEDIRENESTSSTRMRATDKACFKALENLGDLSGYKSQYDTHDYNVLIYELIDTYLEDLTTRTISQNDTQICVEITGFLNKNNIQFAITALAEKQQAQYPEKLEIESNALTLPSPNEEMPKPEIKISDKIAIEKTLNGEIEQPENEKKNDINLSATKTKIFIESTKFFDGTNTTAFYKDISLILEQNKYLEIATGINDVDYIIKTKVLRAKVDPINKQTNRLQMVIAIELTDVKNETKILEHQNRFILFESSDNEQKVATDLLRKLLKKATKQIMPKIKTMQDKTGAIITPP